MVIAALAIGLLHVSTIWLPRALIAAAAAFIAVMLARKARSLTQSMLAHPPRDLDSDRKPSRAQRRVMRASLQVALDQTELRSLFPALMARADRWVTAAR